LPTYLTQIPMGASLVFQNGLGKHLRIGGEVSAENNGESPHVADTVGHQVPQEHRQEERSGQKREHHIVLQKLTTHFASHGQEVLLQLLLSFLTFKYIAKTQILDGNTPMEQQCEQNGEERQETIGRPPAMLRT